MQQRYPVFIKASHGGFVARVPDLRLMVPSTSHDYEKFIVLVKDTMFTVIKALTEDGCDIPPPSNWFYYLNKVPPHELYYMLSPKEDMEKYDRPDIPLVKRQLDRIRIKKFGKIPDGIHNGYIYPGTRKEKPVQEKESA